MSSASIAPVTPAALAQRIRSGTAPLVLDVRSGVEYARGHVPGARHVPFWRVSRSTVARLGVAATDPVVVYCGHGPRAQVAAALLRWAGIPRVSLLEGHWSAWRRAGLPIER